MDSCGLQQASDRALVLLDQALQNRLELPGRLRP
jgi:hypothetical protein